MVPDENISAMAEALAIHHLFLNTVFLPLRRMSPFAAIQ
jgi:hypothetical protein